MGPILMELRHFEFLEGGPKRPKIGENWTPRIYFLFIFVPAPWSFCIGVYFSQYYGTVRVGEKKLRYTGEHEKGVKINPPIWYSPFPHTNPLFCTLGQRFNLIFWSYPC